MRCSATAFITYAHTTPTRLPLHDILVIGEGQGQGQSQGQGQGNRSSVESLSNSYRIGQITKNYKNAKDFDRFFHVADASRMRGGFPRGGRPGPGGRRTQREPFARRSREKTLPAMARNFARKLPREIASEKVGRKIGPENGQLMGKRF